MQSEIHVHKVLDLIDNPQTLSLSQIETSVYDRYGSAVRFRSCSREGMSLPEAIAFLESKGKIRLQGERVVRLNGGAACSHD